MLIWHMYTVKWLVLLSQHTWAISSSVQSILSTDPVVEEELAMWEENLNWEKAFTNWPVDKSVEEFSWLMSER